MRVNISYSVDLDDIPDKVLEFLDGVKEQQRNELAEALESITGAMEHRNYVVATEQIAAMRNTLAAMDICLDDCMHILAGYSKTLADIANGKKGEEGKMEHPPEMVAALEQELIRMQEKRNELNSKKEDGG